MKTKVIFTRFFLICVNAAIIVNEKITNILNDVRDLFLEFCVVRLKMVVLNASVGTDNDFKLRINGVETPNWGTITFIKNKLFLNKEDALKFLENVINEAICWTKQGHEHDWNSLKESILEDIKNGETAIEFGGNSTMEYSIMYLKSKEEKEIDLKNYEEYVKQSLMDEEYEEKDEEYEEK